MSQAFRLALRDLSRGGRGLWLLALCLFLGAAALAGIGSLSASITAALDAQSRASLGGDLELRVSQRRATVEEGAAFAGAGRLSETVRMRAMAQAVADADDAQSSLRRSRGEGDRTKCGGGAISAVEAPPPCFAWSPSPSATRTGRTNSAPALVTLKAVDDAWPMVGRFRLAPGALSPRPHGLEAAIAPALADRLGVKVGDRLRVGAARLRIVGLVEDEPDKLGEGFRLGPVVLTDMAGLDATGLVQPGSLFESRYHLSLAAGADPAAIGARLVARFPGAGWSLRTPQGATDTLRRTIVRLGQFLLLVGLAALAIAGVGVGSGVGAYLGRKTRTIATLKVLGARSATIAAMFLIELALVAGGGVLAGLAVGAAFPALVSAIAGDRLPVPLALGLYPSPLLTAAALALIVALLFALPALARARALPAASLLRDALAPSRRPGAAVLAGMALLLLALVGLAVLTASDRAIALGFVGAAGGLIVLLWGLGLLLRWLLARLPSPRRPLLRLALANLHRPGAPTAWLVVALGLGFSLFVALAVIDSSLSHELEAAAPAKAPRFFAVDLQPEDEGRFRSAVAAAAPGARIETSPTLRGAIVALKGVRVADMKSLPEGAWILRGDRNLTWSASLPPRNQVVAGHWWPPGYRGPPLVSLEDKAAQTLGLKVGDSIAVSVLGVEIPARIAALRRVDWGGMGLNFAVIFSPGYIEEAPHGLLASIYADPGRDGAVSRAIAEALPSVSMIRTGDIISEVGELTANIALAIRAAAAVTVAAGIVVLIGAITASGQARRYDIAILKLLGGSRRQLLLGQAIEYGLLSLLLVAVALAVGGTGGWYVVTRIFDLAWAPNAGLVAVTLAAAVAATLGVGLVGNLPALRARPSAMLREA